MARSSMKSRHMQLLLYREDESHLKALDYISSTYSYAYIIHDSDLDSDGVLKKEHVHVAVSFPSPRYPSAVAKELGITDNYIRPCPDWRCFIRYLIHKDSPSKFQYSSDLIQTNIRDEVDKQLDDAPIATESEKVMAIVDMLDGISDYVETRTFVRMICQAGKYDVFRRSQTVFLQILKEHNAAWTRSLENL